MRNLQAAALFAVPVLAAPIATSSEFKPITSSQLVTIPLAVGEDGFEIVSLRLNVHATDKACDPSIVSFNDKPLAVDGNNAGSGPLALENGQVITAEWQFSCYEPSQYVDMTITSFDGDDIPRVSFTAHLLYSPLTGEADATVGPPQVNDAPSTDDDADGMRDLRHTKLVAERERTEQLRAEVAKLQELYSKINDEDSSSKHPSEEVSTKLKDCETSRCMWRAIKAKVKAAVANLREKVLGSDESDDSLETIMHSGDTVHEQPLTDGFVSQQLPSEHQPGTLTAQEKMMRSSQSSRQALISALFLALFAFSLFTFFSLLYTHRERIRTALAARRARRRERRLRTREERRAAREVRKQAIRHFICRFFSSLIDFDAEKRAAEEERRRALAERQAEEGRRTVHEEQETSMEQELAGLRAAAAMVDDLVSGRRHQVQDSELPQQQEPHPPPVPPRPPIAGFVTYDDPLPTYEEQSHDSAIVADGFRYEQRRTALESHHLPVPERSGDRLGYNK